MNADKISIIVPIYNVEKYLTRCIESLINQTYENIEIILVNDGSSDKCGYICERYKNIDNRVIVIHQQNLGVSAARNKGLRVATGEYIGFCDPDDWANVGMYEEMLTAIKDTSTDIAICGYDYYDEEERIDWKRKYVVRSNEVISQFEIMKRMSDMPPTIRLGVWNKLFKYKILKNQRFKEGLHSSEDVLYLTEYMRKISSAVIINSPLYNNTVRNGSATHGGLSIEDLVDSFDVHKKMYMVTIELYPTLKDHALAFLMDVYMLKYEEAKKKLAKMPQNRQEIMFPRLKEMRKMIRKYSWRALFNREIYWKTRILYLLIR